MINLTVNGKPRPIDDSMDLESYLDSFGLDLKHVAVGYNGDVLKREQYPEVTFCGMATSWRLSVRWAGADGPSSDKLRMSQPSYP